MVGVREVCDRGDLCPGIDRADGRLFALRCRPRCRCESDDIVRDPSASRCHRDHLLTRGCVCRQQGLSRRLSRTVHIASATSSNFETSVHIDRISKLEQCRGSRGNPRSACADVQRTVAPDVEVACQIEDIVGRCRCSVGQSTASTDVTFTVGGRCGRVHRDRNRAVVRSLPGELPSDDGHVGSGNRGGRASPQRPCPVSRGCVAKECRVPCRRPTDSDVIGR